MKFKNLLKLSFFTLPASIIIFLAANSFMGIIMGGIATTKGFPIPYYRDVWSTPGIDFNQPLVVLLDVLIIYLFITFVAYNLIGQKNK
jgi:hypothetical protein